MIDAKIPGKDRWSNIPIARNMDQSRSEIKASSFMNETYLGTRLSTTHEMKQ
jgi:hypothetical protein